MNIWKNVLSFVLASVICFGLALPAAASSTGTSGQTTVAAAGTHHSAIIDNNHSLWSWGSNEYGQVGNGGASNSTYVEHSYINYPDGTFADNPITYNIQTTPVRVLENVVSVSCGAYFTAAIKEDGTLWMWGDNSMGQLGDGTSTNRNTPVQVLDQVAAVSCGHSSTAAIRFDGSLWVWGHNLYGQLGTGGVTNSIVTGWAGNQLPVQTTPVKIMDNVTTVSCGPFHTAAIKTDETLWVWGRNASNQLNLGDSIKVQLTPVQVRSQVKTVCCGDDSIIFMNTDSSLTSWGSCLRPAPTWKDVTAITWASGWHSGYIRSDGSLWTRGYMHPNIMNSNGESIKQMDNVCAVAGGSWHILAVQADGSVWAWGYNQYGQVGNGGLGEVDLNFTVNLLQKTPYKLSGITAAIPGSIPAPTVNAPKTNGGATVSAWALETVNSAEENNLVPNSLAGGNMTQNITRADFAAVAVKLYEALTGQTVQVGDNPFTDTNNPDVLKAYSLGIVNGASPTTFAPDSPVTREQAAVMLTNVYAVLGYNAPQVSAAGFADDGSISPWALNAVSFMSERGIISGVGNNTFNPKGNASIEQALVISYRILTAQKR